MTIKDISILIAGLLLIVIGIIVKNKRKYDWIAGFNTMTDEQKKNFDIEGYAILFRNCLIFLGTTMIIVFYLFAFFNYYKIAQVSVVCLILFTLTYLLAKGRKFNLNKK